MCTVTILPRPWTETHAARWADHAQSLDASDPWQLRVVFNRDESRRRPAALPPNLRTDGSRQGLMPLDPGSRGGWLAVSDAGLVFALLNVNEGQEQEGASARRSRGEIIPLLLASADPNEAVARALALAPCDYLPFQLLIIAPGEVHALKANCLAWTEHLCTPLTEPRIFTSSGLGDRVVQPPRQELFARMFAAPPESAAEWAERQDGFHSHAWPQQRHLSVLMSRDDARTVSQTTIELGRHRAILEYRPLEELAARRDVVVQRTLPLADVAGLAAGVRR